MTWPGAPVTLHAWQTRRRDIGAAIVRMAVDPRRLRRDPRIRFVKLLGTAQGFGLAHADPCRWAALTVWRPAGASGNPTASAGGNPTAGASGNPTASAGGNPTADASGNPTAGAGGALAGAGDPFAAWHRLATAACRLDLALLHSRGAWAGTSFDDLVPPADRPDDDGPGPVLALTRARLRLRRVPAFWRAVGAVAADLRDDARDDARDDGGARDGPLAAFGIGEAPIGWQGTVSVWARQADLVDFAYRQARHQRAITASTTGRWYAEELFARFAVIDTSGDLGVIGWRRTGRPAYG